MQPSDRKGCGFRRGCSARSRDFQVVGGPTAVNSRQEGRGGEARFELKAGAAGVGECGASPFPPSPHALSKITNLSPASSQSSTPSLTRSPTKTSSIPPLQLDPDSFPFKSKLFMPVFNDLRYLIHTDPVEALIRWYVLLSLYRFTYSLATLSLSISDFGLLCLPSVCRLPL